MKKYLAGMVFGLVLASGVGAYAGGGMVGKVIDSEYPLWVHGNKLEKDVIVIEGVSYAPVRIIGEKLGMDVEFKDGQIFLDYKGRKSLPLYKFKSDIIRVNQPQFYVVKDGEWYIRVNAFDGFNADGEVDFDGKDTITITMPWGKKAVFHKSDEYYPGIAGFMENDRAVVSLTALGLKPVVSGDTVTLVRIEE